MNTEEIIKALRDMAKYPTVTLPRDSEALKAAADLLAQPEQEPVAWMSPSWIDPDTRGWQSDSFESIPIEGWLPIYTTPPQRTWVGLTAEERLDIWTNTATPMLIAATEAELKDKNNG